MCFMKSQKDFYAKLDINKYLFSLFNKHRNILNYIFDSADVRTSAYIIKIILWIS